MTDRPLGIADLFLDGDLDAPTVHDMPHVHFWCRRHKRAHKVGEKCGECEGCVATGPGPDNSWPDGPPFMDIDCPQHGEHIDQGPFMSEREANRMAGGYKRGNGYVPPLGMEIES